MPLPSTFLPLHKSDSLNSSAGTDKSVSLWEPHLSHTSLGFRVISDGSTEPKREARLFRLTS